MPSNDPYRPARLELLARRIERLRQHMLDHEQRLHEAIAATHPLHRASARNMAHYWALRQIDVRPLQRELANLGLSSLGRSEACALANVERVFELLQRLRGAPYSHADAAPVKNASAGIKLLEKRATALLGEPAPGRKVRIMVTLPSEAAKDRDLVQAMVESGMDLARINCAHDDPTCWRAMAQNVRQAATAHGKEVRILMDLAGPKLRTGTFAPGPAVSKIRPQRDALGRVTEAARIALRPWGDAEIPDLSAPTFGVAPEWFASLAVGDAVFCIDARGARRHLEIVSKSTQYAVAQCFQTIYLTPQTELVVWRDEKLSSSGPLEGVAQQKGSIRLKAGQLVDLIREEDYAAAAAHGDAIAAIPCTLPAVFAHVRAGEWVFFDDGRIGGIVREAAKNRLRIEIVRARPGGEKLESDKGINFPDSRLQLPALTAKDRADLSVVAELADMVGFSFVQTRADIAALEHAMREIGRLDLGVVLKIETRRAFENLPELILAAMRFENIGVMIARGDLAVECGFARLAEVQEEILWLAEAAHIPTIWATQVLENLAKEGLPSRAEITDAAMGERAECVMLNKGPHIVEAIHELDNILRRMQEHQMKKRTLMRPLRSWASARSH